MMPEIALNILDIAENSVRAGASVIDISVDIQTGEDRMTVIIEDNGCGMTKEEKERVQDPFYTTRTTRKVGLGIPFFSQAALSTDGWFGIDSEKGKGTRVKAVFGLSHIDRMPLGDINSVIHTLVIFNEHIRFRYTYRYNDRCFILDTGNIREILGEDISFRNAEVSGFIKEYLTEGKEETDNGADIY